MAGAPDERGLVVDERARERLAEGRQLLAAILSEHEMLRPGAWAGSPPDVKYRAALRRYEEWNPADQLSCLAVEQLRCLLLAVAERVTNEQGFLTDAQYLLLELPERDLGLSAADVRLLAAVSEPGEGTNSWTPFDLVVDLVDRLLRDRAAGAAELADVVADRVLGWTVMAYPHADWAVYRDPLTRIQDKALELAGRPPLPSAEGVVARADGYGLALIAWLGPAPDWPQGAAELLAHSAKAGSARPSARWKNACRQRLDATADAPALLRGLLDLVVTTEPVTFLGAGWRRAVLIGYNEELVRGLVWAAGVLDPDWLAEVLLAVAVRCLQLCPGPSYPPKPVPGTKIPFACFRALGQSGSEASLRALAQLGQATTNRRLLQEADRALTQADARRLSASSR
jgi:hypothetical protein